jgi:glycosyltransferase involved in cell wall biosynthesis
MTGADRDWVTLANALGPEQVRISWAGLQGCDSLRPYLDARIVTRLLDLDLPWFTYLIQENAYQERSGWRWIKILADHFLRLRRPLQKLTSALRADPVDLVISNTAAVTLGAIYAKLYRKPHVWCIKECLDSEVPACRNFARLVSRMSSAVVAPSRAVARPFPSGVKILPDGSNIEAIRLNAQRSSRAEVLSRLNLPLERPVVAQVGGVVWWKGQHVTAEALQRIAAREPQPRFSFLFLGGGNPSYREKIEASLASAPPQWRDAIRFVCFAPDDFSYVAAADIVVHPSVLPDPFPNAVREAMILGKPVIASRDGGIVDMIRDGETGILFQPGNSEELAAAIDRLVASPEERRRLAESAQRYAENNFDINSRKQAFLELFRDLFKGQSAIGESIASPAA